MHLRKYYYLILIILLSLIALWPFFKKGFFESHDGEWMVIRFSAFHQTLVSGQFPVRFVDRLNGNFGYPVPNFLYPLPFYLAEFPKFLGFGFVDSIKTVFAISSVVSAVAMFWALSQIFKRQAAFVGALLYLFVPYRFVDLYVRGSLGENVAFAFIPLSLGCLFKIKNGKPIFLPTLALSVAFLILSHNVIAVIFLPFFLALARLLIKDHFIKVISAFLLGIMAAAFFWLPALYDLQFVRLSQIKVSEVSHHLVTLADLIVPRWGYGPRPTGIGSFSPQAGLVSLAIFLGVFYLRIVGKVRSLLVDFLLLTFAVTFLLMSKISIPFWQIVPFVDTVQFPWRLLSLSVFVTSLLAANIIENATRKTAIATLLAIAAVISTIAYVRPVNFVDRNDGFYATNEDTTTVQDEYLPLWVKEKPLQRAQNKFEAVEGQAEISPVSIRSTIYKAHISASQQSKIQINTIYFPGFEVNANGRKLPINYQNKYGLITFDLPPGEHNVIVNFTGSPVHVASEAISSIALLIIGFTFYKLWSRKKIKN